MVCWALIGAQGRYRLATTVASACTLLITLPIGIYLTLELRYNLKGLTFAVVVGNSVTAMCLTYVLLMSNWENLSLKAQRKSKVNGVSHSDSMSTEDSSESENEDTSPEISSGGIYTKALPMTSQQRELLVAKEESVVSDIEVTAGDFSKVLREADEHRRGPVSSPRWGAVLGRNVFSLKSKMSTARNSISKSVRWAMQKSAVGRMAEGRDVLAFVSVVPTDISSNARDRSLC